VFIEKHTNRNWSIILKHKVHGVMRKDNLKFMPQLGMAKRFFKSKIDNINNEKGTVKNVVKPKIVPEKLSIEEIESWIRKDP